MTTEEYESYRKLIGKIIFSRYRWFVNKFPDLKEDMVQTGLYTILKCEKTFDPSLPTRFTTYIYRPISNALLIFVCEWLGYEGSQAKRRPRFENESLEGMFDSMVAYTSDGGSNDSTRNKYLMSIDKNFERVDLWEMFFKHTTPKEFEILVLMAKGFTQTEIARAWGFHPHTVNNYFLRAKKKIINASM